MGVSTWTRHEVHVLHVLWPSDLSVADLSIAVGHSKNAVIAKAHREGLPPRMPERVIKAAEPGSDRWMTEVAVSCDVHLADLRREFRGRRYPNERIGHELLPSRGQIGASSHASYCGSPAAMCAAS